MRTIVLISCVSKKQSHKAKARDLYTSPLFKYALHYAESLHPDDIYILFEKDEEAHGTQRIVRIGTHTGKDQLRSRLKQHFLNENKDRSIFRKNIGRALLNKTHDPFLVQWELDLTTKDSRDENSMTVDFEKQVRIEKEVSAYIQKNFSFVVIRIDDKSERLALESKLISTVSRCEECKSSPHWLGIHSPKEKIRESGLWLVNELYKTPLTQAELRLFEQNFKNHSLFHV